MRIALKWLGWADEWSPPAEHSQDWLAEALPSGRDDRHRLNGGPIAGK
jgi:hypothetical protein